MKKISIPLVLASFLLVACVGDNTRFFEVRGYGYVHLTIKDENGNPFKDKEAERFKIQCSTIFDDTTISTIINKEDNLIFSLGRIDVTYHDRKRLKAKDGFTDKEIIAGIEAGQRFSLRDTQNEYETVHDMLYKDAYVDFTRTNWKVSLNLTEPTHIYNCEVRLKKR